MSGNVWEWTRSAYGAYPYVAEDGREDLKGSSRNDCEVRGGAFYAASRSIRCAARPWLDPWYADAGFRVVLSPFPP